MTDAFRDLLKVDNTLIRKWGRSLLAVQDYSEPVPTTFFNATTKIPTLPASARQLGFITTDGATMGKQISANETFMWQSISPVRSDLESMSYSIQASFGEASNAYVHAVYNGVQVKDFPEAPNAPFVFGKDEDFVDFPYYRVWLIAADGVGDQAFYRIEYAPRAKVTAVTDRKLVRANPEEIGLTFSAFEDKVAGGLPVWTMENGPGFGVTP